MDARGTAGIDGGGCRSGSVVREHARGATFTGHSTHQQALQAHLDFLVSSWSCCSSAASSALACLGRWAARRLGARRGGVAMLLLLLNG